MEPGPPPDVDEARRRYRALASGYDRHTRVVATLRRRAVERLGLRAGDHALDMGCGTGASFGDLRSMVGTAGRVTGVELSEDMAAVARRRIAEHGWTNVEVVVGDAATASLPSDVDGILFFETHDLMRTPAAVHRAVAAGRAGAGVVAFGPKAAPWWALPVGMIVRSVAPLRDHLRGVRRALEPPGRRGSRPARPPLFLGSAYLAVGRTGDASTR